MAVCGRCHLCGEKFNCQPGKRCADCAHGDAGQVPATLSWSIVNVHGNVETFSRPVCRDCITSIGGGSAAGAVACIMQLVNNLRRGR